MVSTALRYSTDPAWADVEPIPQLDGGPHALAEIAYTPEYSEAMSYLRALMAKGERSERALGLTAHLARLNPGHYTVWSYRATIVRALNKDLVEELAWVTSIAIEHQKNYQIWGYRQTIMESLANPTGEQDILAKMLSRDAKNYHVWTYRQWMVRHFGLWPGVDAAAASVDGAASFARAEMAARELADVDGLINRDLRNNSAWNHRWFLLFGRSEHDNKTHGLSDPWADEGLIDREIEYAVSKIRIVHQNEASWNYLRGLILKTYAVRGVAGYINLVAGLCIPSPSTTDSPSAAAAANTSSPSLSPTVLKTTKTSYGIDILAELLVSDNRFEPALDCLDLLSEQLDPLRRPYWGIRRAEIWTKMGADKAEELQARRRREKENEDENKEGKSDGVEGAVAQVPVAASS